MAMCTALPVICAVALGACDMNGVRTRWYALRDPMIDVFCSGCARAVIVDRAVRVEVFLDDARSLMCVNRCARYLI